MTWKPAEKRWIKRIPAGYPDAGKLIQVGKRKLQKLYPDIFVNATRTGSRAAANQYWQDFIESQNANAVMYDAAIRKRQIIIEAERIRQEDFVKSAAWDYRLPGQPQDRLRMYHAEKKTLEQQIELLEAQKADGLDYGETDTEIPDLPTLPVLLPCDEAEAVKQESKQSLSVLIAEKIERLEKRTKLKPTNKKYLSVSGFGNQKRFLNSILDCLGDVHIDSINEKAVIKYHDYVDTKNIAEKTKIDYWVYFKEFVKGCCDDAVKQKLPLNLNKKSLNFSPDPKTPDPATIAESNYVLGVLQEKKRPLLELTVLLHLNCGMYSRDIALLKKSDVDLKNKTLTYKRTKATKHEQIEKVTYPLWSRTVELLRMLESDHETYWLTTRNCTNYAVGANGKRKDILGKTFGIFKRDYLPEYNKALKDFRKTGSTELDNQKHPDKIARQFLQRSAEDTKDRYYSGQMRTPFTDAIESLEMLFKTQPQKKK
tara:strand:+ start:143376 stop:144824 length:1449 start_codon:yes stop_codon:yes gene_type:complete